MGLAGTGYLRRSPLTERQPGQPGTTLSGGCDSQPVPPFADGEPWGIEFEEGPDGNYWRNRWHVLTENGEGTLLATFEFQSHAEEFVARCGPSLNGEPIPVVDVPIAPVTDTTTKEGNG